MRKRLLRPGVFLLVLAALGGCSEGDEITPPLDLAAPVEPVAAATDTTGTGVYPLLRTDSLASSLVVRGVIGPKGGTLRIREAGLKVDFPRDALATPTEITITATVGRMVSYRFEPHGLSFAKPVQVEQETKKTWSYKSKLIEDRIEAAYHESDPWADLQDDGWISARELEPAEVDVKNNRVRFEIHHFSGYIISTGRSREVRDSE